MGPAGGQHFRQHRFYLEALRLWKIIALRVAPRAADQPVEKQLRDIDQHQAGQDFVGVETRLQKCGNARVERAAGNAHQKHQRQDHRRMPLGIENRQDRARDRPDRELALGADIPVVRAVTDRKPDRDQDQRCGLDGQFMQRPDFQKRLDKETVERRARVLAERPEQDRPADQCQHQRQKRRENRKQRRDAGTLLQFNAHALPPARTAWRQGSNGSHGCHPSSARSAPATGCRPDAAPTICPPR